MQRLHSPPIDNLDSAHKEFQLSRRALLRDTRALERSTHLMERLQASAAWRNAEEEFWATGRADVVLNTLTDATDTITRDAYRTWIEPVCPESAVMLAVGA